MVELSGNIPFLWRLSAESSDGFCAVSMVVPFDSEDDNEERIDLTIETSVMSFSSDSSRSEREEMLEWNQDDMSLFLKLVTFHQDGEFAEATDSVRVDLTDPEIIEIIHVVAAAGFGTAYSSAGVIQDAVGRFPPHACDVGSFAALNTVAGFKRCVVVDMDNDDVICVLLEDVPGVEPTSEYERLTRHDLLMVKQTDLLHPDFCHSTQRPRHATLH
ncbi:MAG: hypothetical protein P1V33_06945 [Pseudohongiella nitratireducens]|nr:hypothetical protein [Pseudohongiella nitratireducens]MDF1623186.1 hypothetical protein [Pseudohongiella nitratireducens]